MGVWVTSEIPFGPGTELHPMPRGELMNGKRFLINTASSGASSPPPTVVTNWQAGLKK